MYIWTDFKQIILYYRNEMQKKSQNERGLDVNHVPGTSLFSSLFLHSVNENLGHFIF